MNDKPLSISWSALRNHAECKQKSALLRAGKRGPAKDIRAYFHGMVADKIMRDWLADPHRSAGAMAEQVDTYITDCAQQAVNDGDGIVRWRHAQDRAELRRFCVELLTRLEPLLRQIVLPYEFHSAYSFRQPVTIPDLAGKPTTIFLRGEMDLLTREPEGWAVWDLKATADTQYWRKVVGQLLFYDLAVLAEHGRPTIRVGLIQPMCSAPTLQWQVTDDQRRGIWSAILTMAHDIWRNDQTCKSGTDGCIYCDVRHACPRFSQSPLIAGPATRHSTPAVDTLAEALRQAAYTAAEPT